MKNPNGPYPGRQLFLGLTAGGNPAFAYLVTGRSPASRERKGTTFENGVIMGPIGNEAYDWLRHYTGIKYDNSIGMLVVTNGIQTESIYETYKLLYHTGSAPEQDYMQKIMDGANYEPDSLHTPRISGIITNPAGETGPVYILGIATDNPPAKTWKISPEPGTLTGISTYSGDMENPAAFDVDAALPVLDIKAETPQEIAEFVYEISAETNQGDDIRVCGIGGVRSDDNLTWKLAVINRHK
ncbi:IMP cyclohydrolase [Chloroflexota bacterium]